MGNKQSTPAPAASAFSAGQRSASFRTFLDSYSNIEDVQADLRRSGLESCNLILGIDFTKSNEWTGKTSFQGRCLHALGTQPNPYEQAIAIIGATLRAFDDDGLIPAYGFGCSRTTDRDVFSFNPGDAPCIGFEAVLARYRQIVPAATLAGPTSFGPIIRKAMQLVAASGQYHILVIVADGQVTRSQDTPAHALSPHEQDTVDAIVAACKLPLSIVVVGVGDGPWDVMKEFDDRIPQRTFDNFNFVELNSTLAAAQRACGPGTAPEAVKSKMEAAFALQCLMEIPPQFRFVSGQGLMGSTVTRRVAVPAVRCVDPPAPMAPVPTAIPVPMQMQQMQMSPQMQMHMASGGGSGGYVMPLPQGPGGSMMYGAPPPGYGMPMQMPPPGYGGPGGPGSGVYMLPSPQAGYGGAGGGYADPHMAKTAGASAPAHIHTTASPSSAAAHAGASGGAGGGSGSGGGRSAVSDDPMTPEASRLARELEALQEAQNCSICMERRKDTAFQCGHTACAVCAANLSTCHICRQPVASRIKIFN